MRDVDIKDEFQSTASRIVDLSQRVTLRPDHRIQLREELLRRHHQMTLAPASASPPRWWIHTRVVKRLSFVGLPAALGAIVASVLLWILPIAGHQTLQAAEAQRITTAMARTAPTVTAWQWTLHKTGLGQHPRVDRQGSRLTPYQRLYVKNGRAYLYSYGTWQLVTPVQPVHDSTPMSIFWQRAFAGLLASLQGRHFTLLSVKKVDGHATRGIGYLLTQAGEKEIAVTAWVDEQSGLILRLERVVTVGAKVVEREVADYRYQRTK